MATVCGGLLEQRMLIVRVLVAWIIMLGVEKVFDLLC
jgi:hypothetical protein